MLPTDTQDFTQILGFYQQFENRTAFCGVDTMVESDSCKVIYIWRARIQRIPKHYLCVAKIIEIVQDQEWDMRENRFSGTF
jgi:hypothetical protein